MGLEFYVFLRCLMVPSEPIYSLFLAIFRQLLHGNENIYLMIVVVVQGIIAAICALVFTSYVSKEMELSNVLSLGVWVFPYLVSLLFRFVADDHFMYSNTILTEGLAVSLHLLFVRFVFEYLRYQSKRSMIGVAFFVLSELV